ncbi:hypothetical protein ABVK25_011375 [Lepraria finkii]|uniref:Uncharacterized protein n=1 Tax=Lepraria finkii TaxID=1340010 RepID=A0ABR4ARI8_9LECA
MDTSFNKVYSLHPSTPLKRTKSLKIFTTVKCLVQRPSTKFTLQKRPGSARSNDDAFQSHGNRNKGTSSRSTLRKSFKTEVLWKRRGQTPDMDEYLTLNELESVWNRQDSYLGCVCAPQNITQYTFQEAVEAPLIAKHDISNRLTETARTAPVQSDQTPRIFVQDDSMVIDGSVHPTLRPTAYPSDEEQLTSKPTPPQLAISVPNANWTYGRG